MFKKACMYRAYDQCLVMIQRLACWYLGRRGLYVLRLNWTGVIVSGPLTGLRKWPRGSNCDVLEITMNPDAAMVAMNGADLSWEPRPDR
jgi:hypothetical protein